MAQRSFSTNARELYFLSSCASSPTQAIAESAPPWRPPGAAIGSSRLSSAMNCISSSSCRRDGSSSAPLRGSTDAEGWQRIGRISIARRSHSCTSLQSVSCSENFAIPHEVSGQTVINNSVLASVRVWLLPQKQRIFAGVQWAIFCCGVNPQPCVLLSPFEKRNSTVKRPRAIWRLLANWKRMMLVQLPLSRRI